MKLLTPLLVFAVAGLVLYVVLAPQPTTVPGANSPVNAAGVVADGYADVQAVITFGILSSTGELLASFEKLTVAETLGDPTVEATMPEHTVYPGLPGDECRGYITMSPNGPNVDAVNALSGEQQFVAGEVGVPFGWGHLYLYKDSTYILSFDVVVWGCRDIDIPTTVLSFSKMITFDGQSETFSGAV
jgi:hypothetical protein